MNAIMKILLECGTKHPAYSMSFSELKDGLFSEVAEGNISVTYHPEFKDLALFKYTVDCVAGRNWNKFTLMARGLILDLQNKLVVASPFIKFFNYGEIETCSVSIVESDFTVTEKVDGSLGIMFYYEGKWRIATAGSFVSEQAKWAEKWVEDNLNFNQVNKFDTYLFEIVYPENRIVVYYDFSGLVLIGVIDAFGEEYSYEKTKQVADCLKIRCAKQYLFNDMNSIVKNAEGLDQNHEGYVIRFKNGVRLKVKGDEYVRIHRLISRVTPLAVWESMLNGDNLDDVKKDLPEEMEKDFENMISILEGKLANVVKELEEAHKATEHLSDKEVGILLNNHDGVFSDMTSKKGIRYVFLRRRENFYGPLNDYSSNVRRRVFNTFKPKSNVLEGYVPSSAMNRFTEAEKSA